MVYEAFRLLPAPGGANCLAAKPKPLRTYQVSYRLKLATLRYRRVMHSYFVPVTRRFEIDELNLILAERYCEMGPAPHLLGIEILSTKRLFVTTAPRPATLISPRCP